MSNYFHINMSPVRQDFLNDVISVLIKRRRQLGITQEELNARLGIADRLLGKWECGMRSPTSYNLYCWAYALGMKLALVIVDPDNIAQKRASHHKCKAVNDNRFGIVN